MDHFSISSPVVFRQNTSLKFEFAYNPCHDIFPYETATVAVYSLPSFAINAQNKSQTNDTYDNEKVGNESNTDNSGRSKSILSCGKTEEGTQQQPILIYKSVKMSMVNGRAQIILIVSTKFIHSILYQLHAKITLKAFFKICILHVLLFYL